MILQIGNSLFCRLSRKRKKNNDGFTFFEVMVSATILSVGLVMIYQAFFVCLDYVNHLTYRIHANVLLDNRLADMQQHIRSTGEIPFGTFQKVERVLINNKTVNFEYTANFRSVQSLQEIFQVDLVLSWPERGRNISLSRSAYITAH